MVVLVLLAILVLVASTLSVSVRMELRASDNYAQMLGASDGVRAALPEALAYLENATSVTHLLQPWARTSTVLPDGRRPPVRQRRASQRASDSLARPYDLKIIDLASRLNLNAVKSPEALARFLLAVMPDEMSGGVAQRRAQALLDYRGAFQDALATACLDLRRVPPVGFRRVESLGQLLASPQFPDLFTATELQKLEPHITFFSEASEVQPPRSKKTEECVPLAGLTLEVAYRALVAAYPDKEDRLLRQYAVNLIDYLDPDGVPTVFVDPAHPEPWNCLFGIEQTPLITEVYPDSLTRGSDDGQFVEIHNPWQKAISVAGWRLVIAGGVAGLAGQAMIPLTGVIEPGGYLVVTDNIEVPTPGTEPGTGCFVAIFGQKGEGPGQRLIQSAALELPDKNSFVTLVDDRGHVIDVFSYTDRARPDSRESYQRPDPLLRAFVVGEATPFGAYAPEQTRPAREQLQRLERLFAGRRSGDKVGLGDLLTIPTSYVGLRGSGRSVRFEPHFAQWPQVGRQAARARRQGKSSPTNLDSRLVDIFTTARFERPSRGYPATSRPVSFGKLNVNTCSLEAFQGLDGTFGTKVDLMTPQLVETFANYRRARYEAGLVPFESRSDFLDEVIDPTLTRDDESKAISKLLDQICVGSMSFEVRAQYPPSKTVASQSTSIPVARALWILALDFTPCSIIHFAENSW